ncbi:MAG: winged helix-turn-helix domain-containing protein, partial [Myxococcota bacterium]
MTFYEAAVDVLRREGKPLHYEEITKRALDQGLLSHVGRLPEEIMRSRLLAMARREDGKNVAVVDEGVFGLADWGITQDAEALEATEPVPQQAGESLRPTERIPLTLAERKAVKEAERTGRFEQEDKEARARSRSRRRRPRKDESAGDALAAI